METGGNLATTTTMSTADDFDDYRKTVVTMMASMASMVSVRSVRSMIMMKSTMKEASVRRRNFGKGRWHERCWEQRM